MTQPSQPLASPGPIPEGGYYSRINRHLADWVPPTAQRILEVGCGAGYLGAWLKQQDPRREVVGCEAFAEAAREARSRLDAVVEGDVEALELPYPPGYFDCILYGDVLEHLRDPGALLARHREYLAPAGEIFVCLPNVGHWSVLKELLSGDFAYTDEGLLDRTHLRFFTQKSFVDLLAGAGLQARDLRTLDVPNPAFAAGLALLVQALGIDNPAIAAQANAYQLLVRAGHARRLPPPRLQPTSVVVVTYNSMSTLADCLNSVVASDPCELLVIDNASSDGTAEWLKTFAASHPGTRVIANGENLGFSAASNQGLEAATGDYCVLLNPDTRVTPGWLQTMQAHFHTAPGAPPTGAVGPTSDYVAGAQKVGLYLPASEWQGQPPEAIARALQARRAGQGVPTKLLIGFCMMVAKSALERVGTLDPTLFLGNDDLDLSWRLRLAGYEFVVASDAFVHHVGQVSFKTEPSERTKRLVQESTDALAAKLVQHYGAGRVPSPEALWGIDWFTPGPAWQKAAYGPNRERSLAAAERAYDDRDLAAAAAHYMDALEAHEPDAGVYLKLGVVLLQQDALDKALVALGRSLELAPETVGTLNALGITAFRLGSFAAAEAFFQRVLVLEPHHPAAKKSLIASKQQGMDRGDAIPEALLPLVRLAQSGRPTP